MSKTRSVTVSIGCAIFVALAWLAYAIENLVPMSECTHLRMTLESYLLYARFLALPLPVLGLVLAIAGRRSGRVAALAGGLNIASLLWNCFWLVHWVPFGRFACLRS